MGLKADVTGREGMLPPPKHLIPPLGWQRISVDPALNSASFIGFLRLVYVVISHIKKELCSGFATFTMEFKFSNLFC